MDKPQHTVYWGFTATLIWAVLIFAAFVISQMTTMAGYITYHYGDVSQHQLDVLMLELQNNGTVISLATLVSLLVCTLMILAIIKLKKQASITHYLALHTVSFSQAKHWFLAIIILLVLSDLLSLALGKDVIPSFMEETYSSAQPIWLLWIAIVIAAPLFEELFFRGFLLSGLSASFIGPAAAVIVTSASWAVIHIQYEPYYIVTIFVLGLVLGMARLKTGSTLLTIAMHSLVNCLAMIQLTWTLNKPTALSGLSLY